MYELARSRGAELGADVLWCDGGAGGLSGVSGNVQVGPGSWVKTIGVPYPMKGHRTLYGICGDWLALAVCLGVLGFLMAIPHTKGEPSVKWRQRGQELFARIQGRIRGVISRPPVHSESLIDVSNDPVGS